MALAARATWLIIVCIQRRGPPSPSTGRESISVFISVEIMRAAGFSRNVKKRLVISVIWELADKDKFIFNHRWSKQHMLRFLPFELLCWTDAAACVFFARTCCVQKGCYKKTGNQDRFLGLKLRRRIFVLLIVTFGEITRGMKQLLLILVILSLP